MSVMQYNMVMFDVEWYSYVCVMYDVTLFGYACVWCKFIWVCVSMM